MKTKILTSFIVILCAFLTLGILLIPTVSAEYYYVVGGEILPSPLFMLIYVIIGFIVIIGLTLVALFKRGVLRVPVKV